MTTAWTSGIAEDVGTCVGTGGHSAPCTWVEAGKPSWCAEGGLALLWWEAATLGRETVLLRSGAAILWEWAAWLG